MGTADGQKNSEISLKSDMNMEGKNSKRWSSGVMTLIFLLWVFGLSQRKILQNDQRMSSRGFLMYFDRYLGNFSHSLMRKRYDSLLYEISGSSHSISVRVSSMLWMRPETTRAWLWSSRSPIVVKMRLSVEWNAIFSSDTISATWTKRNFSHFSIQGIFLHQISSSVPEEQSVTQAIFSISQHIVNTFFLTFSGRIFLMRNSRNVSNTIVKRKEISENRARNWFFFLVVVDLY